MNSEALGVAPDGEVSRGGVLHDGLVDCEESILGDWIRHDPRHKE